MLRQVDPGAAVIEVQELRALDNPALLDRPGDRASKSQDTARVDHRRITVEGMCKRSVLGTTHLRIAHRFLQTPQHLGPEVRVLAGDHHAGGWTTAVAVIDGRRGSDVIIDIGIKRRQRKKVVVLAATRQGRPRFSQRLAYVDILAGMVVFDDRAFDQLVELVGAEDGSARQPAVTGVGPGELDAAFVAPVEPAFEQVGDVPAHLVRIGLEHGLDIGHGGKRVTRYGFCSAAG